MSIASIRGATTVNHNTKTEILEATKEVLEAIIFHNNLTLEQIVQINFSATKDLDAIYPAIAARDMGITNASLMCFQEMYVEGSLAQCIRISMLVDADTLDRQSLKHQYLQKAKCLRPDLSE